MNKRKKQIRSAMDIGNMPHLTDEQIWNLKIPLAFFISGALTRFYHIDRHSYPGQVKSVEDWNCILKEMIWTFNEIAYDNPGEPYNILFNKTMKEHPEWYDDSLIEFRHTNNGTMVNMDRWGYHAHMSPEELDKVKQDSKDYNNRIQNGLNLFSKYFLDLWD